MEVKKKRKNKVVLYKVVNAKNATEVIGSFLRNLKNL
jgi:hypothetical protein